MSKVGRPRNQTARRQALVSAAGQAITERGLEGLRIKDIADAAGVSQGSVLYYYPELDDLVLEVHRGAVEGFVESRQRAYDEAAADPAVRLRALVDSGLPASPEDSLHGLLYQLHRRAGRSPGHAELMTSLFAREVGLYSTALEVGAATGVFTLAASAQDLAHGLVALEDGYGLHIVSRNAAVRPERARELVLAHARAVTGCASL
ncbi:TetR/AcrR family transcriptional regulator [Streptomyces luteolus]|uniref:TetR family transcriptional regulator C-terminal domain-containing protein n=1 Tax=Streptomyces luteolus TaxID=3043615 RepID=A0ABT6SVM8_9ACTN|nr:TetR family transcriptional regulator C-terminal domain-containing protein [Streptomyces sp. B-S-A12]MDI3419446.1 TetR family transcriptional regulator C-terminal domain-containing protein [Streptomyces sp. B-S-A12]